MADTSITPNMNLVVPTVGEDPGPDWANNINADLAILDEHNHSSGQGVQINPNGLNINTDLPINGNNLTLVNTVRFNNLLASLAGTAPNLGVIYEAVNELYYNDGVGNVIQLTKAGSVNATTSGISSGTATASFVGGTLVVDANVNTPANVQGASFLFGNNVSGSNYLTLEPPNAMASNYTVTLPPINSSGSTSFMTYDTSNNMGVGPAVTGGITATNIATGGITQPLLAPRSTGTTVGIGGVAVSNSSGSYVTNTRTPSPVTNLSVTISTSGRPVLIFLQGDTTGDNAYIKVVASSNDATFVQMNPLLYNGATNVYTSQLYLGASTATPSGLDTQTPASSVSYLDMTVNGVPGTYTYTMQAQSNSDASVVSIVFQGCVLVAYEI